MLAVPSQVVSPATHLSAWVEASPSSQALPPQPAVAEQEAAPAVPLKHAESRQMLALWDVHKAPVAATPPVPQVQTFAEQELPTSRHPSAHSHLRLAAAVQSDDCFAVAASQRRHSRHSVLLAVSG